MNSKRKKPVLSDIKFLDKIVCQKFIAYLDLILFLQSDPYTSEFKAIVGKDIYGEVGTTIDLK